MIINPSNQIYARTKTPVPRHDDNDPIHAQITHQFLTALFPLPCLTNLLLHFPCPIECFCGDTEPRNMAQNCNMPCTGDSRVACGGKDAMSLFKTKNSCPSPTPTPEHPSPTPPRPSPKPTLGDDSANGAKLIGCYEDDARRRVLHADKTVSSNMNAEVRGVLV